MKFPQSAFLVGAVVASLVPPLSAQTPLSGQLFDGAGGPLVAGTYHVVGFVSVPTGETLTIMPGAILKFANTILDVSGTLDAEGVIFTSDDDESVGVDVTANSTTGSPGQWNRIDFNPDSDASVLTDCTFRYAGSVGFAAIRLDQADITLDGVTISPGAVGTVTNILRERIFR